MTSDLYSKYRPAVFDDVFGQGDAVEYLRKLILQGRTGTKVILTGPVGTGKTTLARIYGKALNCRQPTDRGNPCERCDHCRDGVAFQDYRELDCASDPKGLLYREYLSTLTMPPMRGDRRVLVLDEAHRLPRALADRLLKPLENTGADVAVMILTVDLKSLPTALRSRCRPLKLSLLRPAAAMQLLQKVCLAEGMQWEDEALRLIIELSQGHARSLLTNLDSVTGAITLENVQRSLILGDGDTMARYLIAVLDREYGEQMRLVREWLPEQPALKLEIIRSFLLFLYNDQIRRMRVQTRADFLSVPLRTRELIVERFGRYAEARQVPLEDFWHDVMGFWSQAPEAATDVVLLTFAARFDYLLNGQPPTAAAGDAHPSRPKVAVMASPPHRFRRIQQDPSGALLTADPEEYLSADQVRKLIDAASVLIQGYGVMLNMRMTINFTQMAIGQQSAGAKLLGDTIDELRMRLREWGTEPFHWLYVHEFAATEGHTCQFVAHVPERHHTRVEDYLRKKIAYKAGVGFQAEALVLEMPSAVTVTRLPGGRVGNNSHRKPAERRRLQRHWDYVRLLCRGLDPRLVFRQKPLIELLGIPKAIWRPAGRVGVRRLAISTAVGESAVKRAQEEGLPYLSAFADGAWARIGDGWELDEFEDRQEMARQRKSEEDAIRQRWWRDGAKQAAELERLRTSWSRDPHSWSRSWPVWW